MPEKNLLAMNTTVLAFIGDAVYEVHVRNHVLNSGEASPEKLHRQAVGYVRAEAQAEALKLLIPELTQQELALVKRARNRKITSKPRNADPIEYKMATAFEALVGGLYLRQDHERLEQLLVRTLAIIDKLTAEKATGAKSKASLNSTINETT
jgi:ribonuclease-3 family protein